jgi:YD repeat-containing protein
VIDQRRATYDQKQNKTLRAQTTPFYQGGDTTTNVFEYDPLDRLSRAINTKGTGATVRLYTLDGVGNRQVVSSNGIAEPYSMEATIPPADFQMNQYTMTPFGSQSYDENGNLVGRTGAGGPTFYQYDYADRLVEVAAFSGGALGPVASFSYDALGRRIRSTTYPPLPLAPVTTQYVHDNGDDDCDDDIIEEHENGTLRRTFAVPHVFEQTGRIMFTDLGQTLYFHEDDLGSVLALTDAGHNVIERYEYDDFGLPQFLTSDGFPMTTNSSPVGNPILFHGMEWDSDTGLYFSKEFSPAEEQLKGNPRHRTAYLDPQTGRALRGKVKVVRDMGGTSFFDNNPWSQHSVNNINGSMPNRISMNVTVPRQTQGATFGEKVNQGLHAAGGALAGKLIVPVAMDKGFRFAGGSAAAILPRSILKSYFQTGDKPTQARQVSQSLSNVLKTKHDTAKNSIGNIR